MPTKTRPIWLSPFPLGETPWPERHAFDTASASRGQWAVPWSDLMMTMFILFAVLFALQSGRISPAGTRETPAQAVFPVVAQPTVALPGHIQRAADDLARLEGHPEVLAIDTVPYAVRLALTPEATAQAALLSRVATILKLSPARVQVVGHAPGSWHEAAQKAQAVAQVLSHHGVDEARIWVTARMLEATQAASLSQGWIDIVLGAAEDVPPPRPRHPPAGIATWLGGEKP